MVDNADISAYAAASYRAPVFRRSLPRETANIFEYRGKWWFSSEDRNWAAEFIGRQERVYYTESGATSQGLGKPAMKIIDGVEAPLGTPRPLCPVQVSTETPTAPAGFSVESVSTGETGDPRTHTYRIGFRTKDGLLPAGEAITITLEDGAMARLRWARPSLDGVTTVVIYGRDAGKEQIIDEVLPFDLEYLDTGGFAPHGQFAANLDEVDTFFYFYTFLRDVNGHLDESGPSPRSKNVSTSEVRTITRTPSFEGILDPARVVDGISAFKTPTQLEMCGSILRSYMSRRVITTKTDHQLATGDEVGILPKHAGSMAEYTPKQVYKASTFTTDLPAPVVTSFGAGADGATAWTAGTVLRVRVAAFRGASWESCQGGVPAEGLASAEAQWTTTTQKARVEWSLGSDDADGFHVYLNDEWLATVPAGIFHLEFDTLATDSARPFPTVNLSRSRVFHFADDPGMSWDPTLAAEAPLGYGAIAKTIETRISWTMHGLSKGDLVYFTGYKELNGGHIVSRVGGEHEFFLHVLTETDDTTSATRKCQLALPEHRFVNKWALYVQRGTSGGTPLQQGVYPIGETRVMDSKPVHGLSVTCDSAYYAMTPEGEVLVEFNPPPRGLRSLKIHNNCLWGIVDNDVVWTPINRPDAWPKACRRPFPVRPTALESYAGALIVLLPNGIGRFDGTDPFNLSFSMTAARDGCTAPNSVQRTAAGLMYLSPRGIMAFQAEANTSVAITEGRIDPSIFSGSSAVPLVYPYLTIHEWPFWWVPTRNSAAWAKCTRDLPSGEAFQSERLVDETIPMLGLIEGARSFYWRGKYYLYFTGAFFGRHGTLVVDTTRRGDGGFPLSHIGLRPSHVHVSDHDKAFVLLGLGYEYEPPV